VSCPGHALLLGEGPPVPNLQKAGWDSRASLNMEARGKILCLCQGLNPDHPIYLYNKDKDRHKIFFIMNLPVKENNFNALGIYLAFSKKDV
jgi:hypothetical protein